MMKRTQSAEGKNRYTMHPLLTYTSETAKSIIIAIIAGYRSVKYSRLSNYYVVVVPMYTLYIYQFAEDVCLSFRQLVLDQGVER